MKKTWLLMILLVILLAGSTALADQARFLNSDGNQTYHSEHLLLHIGSQNCKVSGNYIKVRDAAGSNRILGHLEQSDSFTLNSLNGSWAYITVTYSAKTSPDSYAGLSGWVDANYVECPCSYNEYYYGPAHTTYSLAVVLQNKTNLREGASKGSVSLAIINQDEQVEILSDYTGKDGKTWYRVRYGNQVGFIRNDFVSITETEISEIEKSNSLSTDYANVEAAPTNIPSTAVSAGDSWQELYRAFVLNKVYEQIGYPDYLLDGYDAIAMTDGSEKLEYVGYDYDPIWFSLYDLDNDQTPELLIFNGMGYMAGNFCHVYTFKDHSMVHIGELGRRELFLAHGSDKRFPGLVQTDGNMGYYTTDYWYIQNGEILVETIESIHDGPYLEDEEFEGNDSEPIVTRETSNIELYNWYHNTSFSSLPHWEYSEISKFGWDSFVAAMLQQPTLVSPEPSAVPSDDSDNDSIMGYTWETAMNFEDILLDHHTYPGSWPEAYLSVLSAKESNIRNYESQIADASSYLDGQPLHILIQDINGDAIPEMLLISDSWSNQDSWYYGDLYVYSYDGTQAKCVLSIPEVYKEVEAGPSYSVFTDHADSDSLVIQYYDGWGVWQVRYDAAADFPRQDDLRGIYLKISDDEERDTFYLNGTQISDAEFQSHWLAGNAGTVSVLGSTEYSPAASGMKYDAAIQYLTSLLSTGESSDQDSGSSTPEMVDFGVSNEDVLFVSEGYYFIDNYNTDDYYSFIPVDVFCNKETYKANEPITFSADILGGIPPFTVHWFVEESQVRDGPTPLDHYIESHEDYSSSISYTTNCRHVEYVYTPPVESTALFGCFSMTDSQGISSYSPNEDLAAVDTLTEWREMYPQVGRPEDENFPFAARTNKKNVNVRNGIGKDQDKITTLSTAGTLVKVIGKGYDSTGKKWYVVRLGINQTGCIRSDFLAVE